MSDLNDLIHKNAIIAFRQGEQRERERILNLLVEKENSWGYSQELQWQLVELIKGEQK